MSKPANERGMQTAFSDSARNAASLPKPFPQWRSHSSLMTLAHHDAPRPLPYLASYIQLDLDSSRFPTCAMDHQRPPGTYALVMLYAALNCCSQPRERNHY
jgi:hypothetical protein